MASSLCLLFCRSSLKYAISSIHCLRNSALRMKSGRFAARYSCKTKWQAMCTINSLLVKCNYQAVLHINRCTDYLVIHFINGSNIKIAKRSVLVYTFNHEWKSAVVTVGITEFKHINIHIYIEYNSRKLIYGLQLPRESHRSTRLRNWLADGSTTG
jgi:hypothetical protein